MERNEKLEAAERLEAEAPLAVDLAVKMEAAKRLEVAAQRVVDLAGKAPDQHEGWKGSGQCDTCRRLSYCKKNCTAMKNRVKAAVYVTLAKALLEKGIPTPDQIVEAGQ